MFSILNNEEFKRLLLSWPNRAIKYLYDLHHRSLLKISEQRTHNRKAAEDIVQDAITYLWERRQELARQEDLLIEPYLYKVVKNQSINFYKKVLNLNETLLDEDQLVPGEDENIMSDEMIKELWKVLSTFPAREQQCLIMRYFQDMTYNDIADDLGITVKAVERSLTSARKRLRRFRSNFL